MTLYELLSLLIGLITLVVSVPLSIIAIVISLKSNKIAKNANTIAQREHMLNKKSSDHEFKMTMSEFSIEPTSIMFTNDADLKPTIEESLRLGKIKCSFFIKNISDNDALHAIITQFGSPIGIYPNSVNINKHSSCTVDYSFDSVSLITNETLSADMTDKSFVKRAYLHWTNAGNEYVCPFEFEFAAHIDANMNGQKECHLSVDRDVYCTLSTPYPVQ